MNTFLGLSDETAASVEQPRVIPIREQVQRQAALPVSTVHDEQIHGLVHRIFFSHDSTLVRHVGFVTVDASTDAANLCLDVAKALARENAYDVGLIDARTDAEPLHARLKLPSPKRVDGNWQIAPRLWMVPRQTWLPKPCGQRVTDQSLSRLREVTADFDFSIVCCANVSWLTASIGLACDGLVLVLAAHKTRRLVATQIKQQLSKAQVQLLGTVLVERRFPVPQGLYRSL